jgi:hypothetical protein
MLTSKENKFHHLERRFIQIKSAIISCFLRNQRSVFFQIGTDSCYFLKGLLFLMNLIQKIAWPGYETNYLDRLLELKAKN